MLKENKGYIFMLLAIIFMFIFATVILSQSRQNPYLFTKLLVPITDYVYNKKTIVINTSKNYLLTLNTNKGDIVVELYSPNAPFNVNNIYKLANSKAFDNSSMVLNNGTLNLTALSNEEMVFDEINQSTLNLSPITLDTLSKDGYKSDNTVKSILFEQFSFGVRINQRDGVKDNFFFVIDPSKSSELDGYNTNVGVVVDGKDILTSGNLTVLTSSINEK